MLRRRRPGRHFFRSGGPRRGLPPLGLRRVRPRLTALARPACLRAGRLLVRLLACWRRRRLPCRCLGASVRWWAGGGPAVPMAGRLASRSAALVSAVAASGPGSGLAAFVRYACPPHLLPASSPSAAFSGHASGSWGSLALAAGLGLPVVVFPVSPSGYGDADGTLMPEFWPGSWTPLSTHAWAGGFRFVANPLLQEDLFGPES